MQVRQPLILLASTLLKTVLGSHAVFAVAAWARSIWNATGMVDPMPLLQLVGAGSVGALITQYVSAAPERRQARARARDVMATVEAARWAGGEEGEWQELLTALHAFESAAMVASVPRDVSKWYIRISVAMYRETKRNLEADGDFELGGYLIAEHADAFSAATEVVHDALWRPRLARLTGRRRLARSKREIMKATEGMDELQQDLSEGQWIP